MDRFLTLWRLALVGVCLLIGAALAACGQTTPRVEIGELPDAPGTAIYEGAAEVVIDTLIFAGRDAFGDSFARPTTRLLLIQPPTNRRQTADFYRSALPQQGWAPLPDAALDRSLGSSWQRGQQRLAVAFVTIDDQEIVVLLLTTQP
ncbi:MAG TPA: hypothetical protein VFS21_14555 [Roseiflexaceae bacterium]|nr:hypothetical protein [Roseiflexaceae bacterium]